MKVLNNKRVVMLSFAALLTLPVVLMADMDRCVSCHGVDFEKKALGVSKVVKDMSEADIKAALDGYKKGKGGSLKDVMIAEVNLGVDTDAMSADVYNEAITPGFEEPSDEFIFQKRLSVRTLDKLKKSIKKADGKKDMNKVVSKIKSAAFTMYVYDDLLKQKVDFKTLKPNQTKLTKKEILQTVTKVKKCVDHSFTEEDMVKCRVDFVNLAGSITRDEEKKIKAKQKKGKAPLYTGEHAVDISKYLHKHD